MLRREILGNVISTTINVALTNSATSISLLNGTTFPTGATAPFVIVIDRGNASEEKILVQSRSANTLTVASGGRGYDGTPAVAHANAATVDHVLDATTIQDMNTTVYDTELLTWVV